MEQIKDMFKQMIDFNKTAYENAFKTMNLFQEQTEKMFTLYIDAVGVSDEGKKAAKQMASMYKKGYEDFKKLVDHNLKQMEALIK